MQANEDGGKMGVNFIQHTDPLKALIHYGAHS